MRPAVPHNEGDAEREDVRRNAIDRTNLLDGRIGAGKPDHHTDVAGNVQNHETDAVRGDGDDEQKQCKHAFIPLW